MTQVKTAFVTGGNKGIGYEIAKQLAEHGYSVWIGCRDLARGEAAVIELKAAGLDVGLVQLDVADPASVLGAAETMARSMGHLDILVNNAGVYLKGDGPASAVELGCMMATYEVNVFGPLRVTQAFLPLLRAAPAARIVMMSSGLGSLAKQSDVTSGLSRWPTLAYSSSKTALNAIMIGFANEFHDTPIKINAADPGFTATDLNGQTGVKTPAEGASIAVRLATLDENGPNGGFFEEGGAEPW